MIGGYVAEGVRGYSTLGLAVHQYVSHMITSIRNDGIGSVVALGDSDAARWGDAAVRSGGSCHGESGH